MSSEARGTEAPLLRGARALYLLGLAALVLVAFFMRLPGLNPRSLYFDDIWVAVLVREASLAKLIALHPHHPLGFLLLLGIGRHLGGNPDLGLQILPLAASLALVPLGALLIRQLGGGAGAGLLGAALVAVNPELAFWSVRVKPYCVDALLTLLLLCAAAATLAKPSLLRLVAFAVLGVATSVLSYPAILVGLVCGGLVVLALGATKRLPVGALAGIAFGSVVSYGLVYLLLLRGQANENLMDFWSSAFVPRDSLSGAASFVWSRTVWLLRRAFPAGWQGLGLVVPIGLATVLFRKKTRELGVACVLIGLAVWTASAARLYPLHARTSTFLYAPLALLGAGGVAALVQGLARGRGVLLAEGGAGVVGVRRRVHRLRTPRGSALRRRWHRPRVRCQGSGDGRSPHLSPRELGGRVLRTLGGAPHLERNGGDEVRGTAREAGSAHVAQCHGIRDRPAPARPGSR